MWVNNNNNNKDIFENISHLAIHNTFETVFFFNSLIDGVYEQKNIFILPLDNTSKNDISILYELFHIKHFLLNRIVSKVKK